MRLIRFIAHSLKLSSSIAIRPMLIVLVLALVGAQIVTSRDEALAQASPKATHISRALSAHPPVIQANGKMLSSAKSAAGNGYCEDGSCFYWATMVDDGISATGASDAMGQPQPIVGPSDQHSLAELAVESADAQQIVEVGWIVAPNVNGDSLSHLFVYHWVQGESTCYNGCGFVPTSTTYTAGGLAKVKTTGTYAIQYSSKKWIVTYNGVELGYFPESIWGGSFTKIGLVQAFGEVASSSATTPDTQMGNGLFGTSTKSTRISDFNLIGSKNTKTLSYTAIQAPSVYKVGQYVNSCVASCGMNFGGPGY